MNSANVSPFGSSPEASRSRRVDPACAQRPVSELKNRTAEFAARLLRVAEDLALLTAEVVAMPQPAPQPVVIQPAPSSERVAWTVAEFADAHGLAKGTVYKLIDDGELRAGRINQSLRISEDERLRWWAECEQRHASELGVA